MLDQGLCSEIGKFKERPEGKWNEGSDTLIPQPAKLPTCNKEMPQGASAPKANGSSFHKEKHQQVKVDTNVIHGAGQVLTQVRRTVSFMHEVLVLFKKHTEAKGCGIFP